MSDFEYSQGVDDDGPVLLKDGQRVGLDELLADISSLQEAAGGLLVALMALLSAQPNFMANSPEVAGARAAIAKAGSA